MTVDAELVRAPATREPRTSQATVLLIVAAVACALAACAGTDRAASSSAPTTAAASTTAAAATTAAVPSTAAGSSAQAAPVLFDDFTYASARQMQRNGWILRTKDGWPGVPGALWTGNVTVGVVDPAFADNRLVRMTASTDGTTTRQAQFCHQRKYYEGTYAARVRFSDAPTEGPDGDQIVQTLYAIAPLKAPLDTDYSELDFEYLPNGGWGGGEHTLFVTTWETFNPEPLWLQINKNTSVQGSRAGWHTLVMQVAGGNVTYFIDDEQLGTHGGPYYPEEPMSINFNHWFIRDQLVESSVPRRYEEDVDWVFHQVGTVLSPVEVRDKVAALREAGVAFRDTVPPRDPPLNSPCDF